MFAITLPTVLHVNTQRTIFSYIVFTLKMESVSKNISLKYSIVKDSNADLTHNE